jgi:outer membrane lipoprotein-sorting protein
MTIAAKASRFYQFFGFFTVAVTFIAALSLTPFALAADDLATVLSKLDAASAKFKSAQADIISENTQTQPIPDTDTQAGTILFEREGGQLQMALHLKTDNGQPAEKDVVYADGLLKFYEPMQKRMTVFKAGNNQNQADTILTVGFGGSGKDLQKSWDVTYSGSEKVDGKTTAKLTLVPKDAGVRNNFPKVALWVDMETGLAVKQQFFDTSGNYRVATYHNVKLNAAVPAKAFEIKMAPGTQIVNH